MTEFDKHNSDKPLICLKVYRQSHKAWMYAFSQYRIDVCISIACISTKHNIDLNWVLLQYFVLCIFTYGLVDTYFTCHTWHFVYTSLDWHLHGHFDIDIHISWTTFWHKHFDMVFTKTFDKWFRHGQFTLVVCLGKWFE